MRHLPACLILTFAALFTFPQGAKADAGYTINPVNLRAGPGLDYPVVTIVRNGDALDIKGCTDNYHWCEVETRYDRGWVSAHYLRYLGSGTSRTTIIDRARDGDVRIIIFKPREYWDDHYRDRPFYRDRDRYNHGRGDGHYHGGKDRDDDDNKGRGHGRGRDRDDDRTEQPAPPRYQKMKPPGDYNPLCRMGEKDC